MPDHVLIEVARKAPESKAALTETRGLPERTLHREHADVVAAVARGKQAEPIPYSEFQALLEQGAIEEVRVSAVSPDAVSQWEAEIVENTSWSCAHGVERWNSDCGCNTGGRPDWNQAWRRPLREALDWLRDEVNPKYEVAASEFFTNSAFHELSPEVFSPFGTFMVMVWGLAYLSVAKQAHQLPAICFVFAFEKAIYVYTWVIWISSKSDMLPIIREETPLLALFYSGYGIIDLAFAFFFFFAGVRAFRN